MNLERGKSAPGQGVEWGACIAIEQEPVMSNSDFLLEEIKASARELTARALTQRQLTEQQIRQVLAAISQGVSQGVAHGTVSGRVKQEMLTLADHTRHILSLIHISEPTRQAEISYAVFCLKKK